MSGGEVLTLVAPLRVTLWFLAVTAAIIVAVVAIGVSRHLEWLLADRRRHRVRGELEPVFDRFFRDEDPGRLAAELRPAFIRMDAAHRPVAAVLIAELMSNAPPSQTGKLRSALEQAGIVELGHRGTRRWSPWRRALACEMLGKIGSPQSVPVLLERLEDRRPEVRMAAVRALGDIAAPDAVPALSEAFLERRAAPINVVGDALRRIGGASLSTFERGIASADPVVRIAACFGLSGLTEARDVCVARLALVLDTERDPRVRTAAAAALGLQGGDHAPAALLRAAGDPEIQVRRSAVKALGSFDDPAGTEPLDERTEDDDRETALRAAEALLALARRPRAAAEAGARLESSSAWAVEYARTVAEVSA